MTLRLIVFDLDGTLVDSRRDLAQSANALLAECGCRQLSEEAIGRMIGEGAATLVKRAFDAAGCRTDRTSGPRPRSPSQTRSDRRACAPTRFRH